MNKVFFDISKFFHKKLAIMKIYENKVSNHPFLRSLETIESIAKVRGAKARCKDAEIFMLLKEIQ